MDDNINMNQRFMEMFDLPRDTVSATLRLRANFPPTITVTRMIFRTGQLSPTRQHDKFTLVPIKEAKNG